MPEMKKDQPAIKDSLGKKFGIGGPLPHNVVMIS